METEYDLELESNLAATVRTSASVHGVHTLPAELRDLRLLILPLLGPEGVIIMISDLEVLNFSKPLDIQFLKARKDILQDASVVPSFIETYI